MRLYGSFRSQFKLFLEIYYTCQDRYQNDRDEEQWSTDQTEVFPGISCRKDRMFTAVPIGVAIARFVPIARTTHHGTGLIPIVSAMEITIGDIRAATVLFCRTGVRTLEVHR